MIARNYKRVFVVDDDRVLLERYRKAFVRDGYGVVEVSSRESLESALRILAPDLILMNTHLDGRSTESLVRDLRRGHRDRKVVVFGDFRELEGAKVARFMAKGACGYVDRNSPLEEVVARVREHLVDES